MSATLDAKLFCGFFGNAPLVSVPGRTFPVSSFHLEDLMDANRDGTMSCEEFNNATGSFYKDKLENLTETYCVNTTKTEKEEETGENYPLETEPFLFFLSVSWPPCNAAINNFNRNPFTAHYQYATKSKYFPTK